MNNSSQRKKIGGGVLLVFCSIYFAFQFKYVSSLNQILGMSASAVLAVIGFYSIYKSRKNISS